MIKMKYSMINANDYFVRKDGENTLVLVKSKGYQFVLNSTGEKILNLLPMYTNTEDIVQEFYSIYEDVDKRVLRNDIEDVIRLFDVYEIIKLEPEVGCISNRKRIMGDKNYRVASDFIVNKAWGNKANIYEADYIEYYKAQALRQRTFTNQEFGAYLEVKGDIKAAITYLLPSYHYYVLTISSIFFDKELEMEEMAEILAELIEYAVSKVGYNYKIKKVRIQINEQVDKVIIDYLKKCGFMFEANLMEECECGNIYLYTLFLK